MLDVVDDATLVREADILLSVLVPAQALALAERIGVAVRTTGSELLFADCNAVSPRTVKSIERLLRGAGAEVVDVGIIGAPPRAGRAETRLYASGPGATRLTVLSEYGLDVRVIGSQVGQASGLKMCYASLTKGLTALATQALTAGEALGLSETLIAELEESQTELFAWFERQVPRMPPKAYHWVGEMEEIARTFADLGLPPQMLEGAAALYRLVEQPELGMEIPEEAPRRVSGGGSGYPGCHTAATSGSLVAIGHRAGAPAIRPADAAAVSMSIHKSWLNTPRGSVVCAVEWRGTQGRPE